MRWLCPLLSGLLLWLPVAVLADAVERERIAAERQLLIDRYARQERECQQRFAVNDCVDDVRRRRREALEPLRARELELDDAERQRRAAERRAAIEAKQRELAARPAPASAPEPPPRRPGGPAAAGSMAEAASAASMPRGSRTEARAREAQAAERARASQRRREDAEAALERVRRRLAEREAAGKTAAPLPVPDAASAPAR